MDHMKDIFTGQLEVFDGVCADYSTLKRISQKCMESKCPGWSFQYVIIRSSNLIPCELPSIDLTVALSFILVLFHTHTQAE